jgi:hypothetical protein
MPHEHKPMTPLSAFVYLGAFFDQTKKALRFRNALSQSIIFRRFSVKIKR